MTEQENPTGHGPAAGRGSPVIRAARIHAFGGSQQLRIEEVDAPVPAPGEVLVRVAAAGTNPLDYKLRDGTSGKAGNLRLPAVLGREMTGVVLEAAADVDLDALGMPVGSWVFGMRGMDDWRGTYAEQVTMRAQDLAPVPAAALGTHGAPRDPHAWAGLALAGVTALTAVDLARISPGDTVLIHGGSGGVGQLMIPLARAAGAAQVWATGRAANAERITALGAQPIAHDQTDWEREIDAATGGRGVDAILDTHYFTTFTPSLDHLAAGGRIVVLPTLADLAPAAARGIEAHIPAITPTRAALDRLAASLATGAVDLEVSAALPLEQAPRAHELLESGHTRGKIVLVP